MPCTEKRARLLLDRGRAVVHKRYPFTIRLKDRTDGELQSLRLSIDPGSRETGLAITREVGNKRHVLSLFELVHRGFQIREALEQRRAFRRRRRGQLRHRQPRFNNRTKCKGWLAPSLQHRVDTTLAWVDRLCQLAPITSLSQELVRFDTQKLENPEISGIEYQRGTLLGYEIREYLLEKWGRECAYCGDKDTPLEIEHVIAKSNGGSNRVTNLTLACHPCNQAKGNDTLEAFFTRDKGLKKRLRQNKLSAETRYQRVIREQKRSLRDAAAVNATRWALHRDLNVTGLPVEVGTGGQTKFNRMTLGIPKTHALDAACVGSLKAQHDWNVPTLVIKAMGRGSYQRTRLNKYGFPRGYLMREKRAYGFQTGDMVSALVPTGEKTGRHQGRVAIRKTGNFNIQTTNGAIQGISHRHCTLVQRGDGYRYHQTATIQPKGEGKQVA
ncbi:HNH endonuclease [Vreelandella rituensis]|uniref:HNH endonuclease n=2 Tax=Vreelandella rituensis TaxID=2282306 RepID=A0A368TZV3_9GAMM|nr:HNH endonuclease [Halomonas rituensis]